MTLFIVAISLVVFGLIPVFLKFLEQFHISGPSIIETATWILQLLRSDSDDFAELFREFLNQHGEYGKIEIFKPLVFYFVYKPDYLKVILNSPGCINKGELITFDDIFPKTFLLTAPHNIWKMKRRIMTPRFNQTLLNSYLPVVNAKVAQLVKRVKNSASNKEEYPIYVTRAFLEIICETFFGVNMDKEIKKVKLYEAIETIERIFALRIIKPWLRPKYTYRYTRYFKVFDNSMQIIKNFTDKVFNLNMEKADLNNKALGEDKSFLKTLISQFKNNEISYEDLVSDVGVILTAGTETNALTISFAMTFLAIRSDIQDKLYTEIIDILSEKKEIDLSALSELKYTECVIKETLRLAPPALFLTRRTSKDVILDESNTLLRNTDIAISIVNLHRSEKYWSNPLRFDPARFLPENSSKIYPYSFLPFSGGPRNCIGQRWAMYMMKIVLAHLVYNFKFSTSYQTEADIQLVNTITTRPKHGFKLDLQRRHNM